jgi:hypothetical protein
VSQSYECLHHDKTQNKKLENLSCKSICNCKKKLTTPRIILKKISVATLLATAKVSQLQLYLQLKKKSQLQVHLQLQNNLTCDATCNSKKENLTFYSTCNSKKKFSLATPLATPKKNLSCNSNCNCKTKSISVATSIATSKKISVATLLAT